MLKHIGDCEKGDVFRDFPTSHSTTSDGEYSRLQTEIPTTVDDERVIWYDYRELPGMLPMVHDKPTWWSSRKS